MTHLIRCLRTLMAEHSIRAADLARKIEISTASLSRILNGQTTPSHETLKLLIRLVAKNDAESREIIRAHLLDEIERLDSADLAAVVVGDGTGEPEYEHLMSSLVQAGRTFEEVAGLAGRIVELSGKQASRLSPKRGGLIQYPDADHPVIQVAETSPQKPKRKK